MNVVCIWNLFLLTWEIQDFEHSRDYFENTSYTFGPHFGRLWSQFFVLIILRFGKPNFWSPNLPLCNSGPIEYWRHLEFKTNKLLKWKRIKPRAIEIVNFFVVRQQLHIFTVMWKITPRIQANLFPFPKTIHQLDYFATNQSPCRWMAVSSRILHVWKKWGSRMLWKLYQALYSLIITSGGALVIASINGWFDWQCHLQTIHPPLKLPVLIGIGGIVNQIILSLNILDQPYIQITNLTRW